MKDLFYKQESSRPFKVADQIKKELAQIIQHEIKDPRLTGMITITDVQVTKDLSYADIYFTNLLDLIGLNSGDEISAEKKAKQQQEQKLQENILKKAAGFLRRRIGQEVKLRIVPHLRFHYDVMQSNANKMDALITKVRSEDAKRAPVTDDNDS